MLFSKFCARRITHSPPDRVHYKDRSGHRVLRVRLTLVCEHFVWPAPGSEDTELGVLMEPEVDHGETEVYPRIQA